MDTVDILITGFTFVGSCLGFLSGLLYWCYFFGGVSRG